MDPQDASERSLVGLLEFHMKLWAGLLFAHGHPAVGEDSGNPSVQIDRVGPLVSEAHDLD